VTTIVYTDGACRGNPGPGGWAWAVTDGGQFASGAAEQTTNQRMEITAAAEAVAAVAGRLEVVSDSTYVVNCFRDRWWEGWLRRGWLNSQRQPVANRDLWEPFIERVRSRGDVTFRWVKGHAGDAMNDLVDRLAVEAAAAQQGRSGTGVPADLGPADSVGAVTSDPAIEGHGLVVLGHRPTELGGYEDNPIAQAVESRLVDIISAKAEIVGDLAVVSGLRLGAETLGAQAAISVGVPLVVVLPYPDAESVWPEGSRQRFRTLIAQATQVIQLQKKAPESKQQAGAAMARRDAWLARNADEAVLVWDGQDANLGRLRRSLEDHLGEDVWIVDPNELV
jgi:ribonuclease HI/uncharacterized phage-like protein YoqJ